MMGKMEFAGMVKRLTDFYERGKEPKQGTMEMWFDKIKHVPDEAIHWVTRKIQDECDNWPHNLTKTICDYHREWQAAHPEKRAHERSFDCPDCNRGLIFAKKQKSSGVVYCYVFNCLLCRQSNVDYPRFSKQDLINQGYEIIGGI